MTRVTLKKKYKTKSGIANNLHFKENETVSVLNIALKQLQQREDEGKAKKMSSMDRNKIAMQFVMLKDKVEQNIELTKQDNIYDLPPLERQKVQVLR